MADGVKFANERIALLEAEIERLQNFIRLSEKLFAEGWLGLVDDADQNAAAVSEKGAFAPATSAASRAVKNGGPGNDEDDRIVLELKSHDEDPASLREKNGADPECENLFRRSNA